MVWVCVECEKNNDLEGRGYCEWCGAKREEPEPTEAQSIDEEKVNKIKEKVGGQYE